MIEAKASPAAGAPHTTGHAHPNSFPRINLLLLSFFVDYIISRSRLKPYFSIKVHYIKERKNNDDTYLTLLRRQDYFELFGFHDFKKNNYNNVFLCCEHGISKKCAHLY